MRSVMILRGPLSFQLSSVYHLNNVTIRTILMRLGVLSVLQQYLIHVSACILMELVVGVEDNKSYLAFTKDTQLISFLHQPKLPLRECYLAIALIIDALNVDLLSTHNVSFSSFLKFVLIK